MPPKYLSVDNASTPLLEQGGKCGPRLLDMPPALSPAPQRFGMPAFLEDTQDVTGGTLPVSVVIAAVIGVVCGIVAWAYYSMLEFLLELIWKTMPERFFVGDPMLPSSLYWTWIPIIGMTCAACVGISVQVFGEPGDLAYTIACVHKKGYIAMSHVLPMLFASQFSILAGGSLGPEAPLVAICASVAGWLSRSVFRQKYKNVVRKHTLMGMACALAAFFGVPLGGSLFAVRGAVRHRLRTAPVAGGEADSTGRLLSSPLPAGDQLAPGLRVL
jgi:H+/Cl- antiporter ClcA